MRERVHLSVYDYKFLIVSVCVVNTFAFVCVNIPFRMWLCVCVCVCVLFNDTSTFLGHLMPNLSTKKNSGDTMTTPSRVCLFVCVCYYNHTEK